MTRTRNYLLIGFVLTGAMSAAAQNIDLALVASKNSVALGGSFEMDLIASTTSASPVEFAAIDAVLVWPSTEIELTGFEDIGPDSWQQFGFS
ncbi:MAG: hypothetical protein AB7N71_10645, partial [Phycisphaerae bacterium]